MAGLGFSHEGSEVLARTGGLERNVESFEAGERGAQPGGGELRAPCGDCRQARATAGDPPALWAWWATLTPARRRLHIAARFGTDPWTGRHVRITAEWTEVDADEQIGTTHLRYLGCTPDGIYWKTTAAY